MDILKAAQFPKFSIDMQLFLQICANLLVLVIEYFYEIVFTTEGITDMKTIDMQIQVVK
jgi:hypothetical protein